MTITTSENAARPDVARDLEERINALNADVQRRIRSESVTITPKAKARRLTDLIRLYTQTF